MSKWLVLIGVATVVAASAASFSVEVAPAGSLHPTVVLADKQGDAEDGNYKRYAARGDVDIRRVEVTRLEGGIRVVIQTAARARRGDIYSFFYYRPDGNGGGIIQVRYRADGTIGADVSLNRGVMISQLPAGAARFVGNRLTISVPNRYLDKIAAFIWQAASGLIDARVDITDEAPNQGTNPLNPKSARYP